MKLRFYTLLMLLMVGSWNTAKANEAFVEPSEYAVLSVLSCTPGPDLYSVFGHTAIRYQDSVDGRWVDWVFNYGTFQFSDDFYVKFARGKLDYMLSVAPFYEFQMEYLQSGRGIFEQVLRLNSDEKKTLVKLLQENYLPENRTYRYDFFYDNCSTRVRDIINKATGNQCNFTYAYAKPFTFRQAIQNYLDYMPWSDFGIDIALGLPCDRVMGKGEGMFLPDSLMHELNYTSLRDGAVSDREEEMIPQEFEPSVNSRFTPLTVFALFMFLTLVLGFIRLRKGVQVVITDRVALLVAGVTGLLVIFLWFFTDHTATKNNLNILWANPLCLLFVFKRAQGIVGWWRKLLQVYTVGLLIMLAGWFFLPQKLHLAIMPLGVALLFYCIKILRPSFLVAAKMRTDQGKEGR
jgi:hypothetical protein